HVPSIVGGERSPDHGSGQSPDRIGAGTGRPARRGVAQAILRLFSRVPGSSQGEVTWYTAFPLGDRDRRPGPIAGLATWLETRGFDHHLRQSLAGGAPEGGTSQRRYPQAASIARTIQSFEPSRTGWRGVTR